MYSFNCGRAEAPGAKVAGGMAAGRLQIAGPTERSPAMGKLSSAAAGNRTDRPGNWLAYHHLTEGGGETRIARGRAVDARETSGTAGAGVWGGSALLHSTRLHSLMRCADGGVKGEAAARRVATWHGVIARAAARVAAETRKGCLICLAVASRDCPTATPDAKGI